MVRGLRKLWAFLRRDLRLAASYRMAWALSAVDVVLTVAAFYFLGRLVDTGAVPALEGYGGYFSFAIVGTGGFSYFFVTVGRLVGELRSAQSRGTLEAMLVTHTSAHALVAYTYAALMLVRTVFMALYVLAAHLLFGLQLGSAAWGSVFVLVGLAATTFLGIGMISSAFIIVFKKGDPLTWALGAVSWLLSGTMYPVEVLPTWLQRAADLVPVTPLLRGLRKAILGGATLREIAPEALALAGFSVIFVSLGYYCLARSLDVARRQGSLGHY